MELDRAIQKKYFNQGYKAYQEGKEKHQNPYQGSQTPREYSWWNDGWEMAKEIEGGIDE